MRGGGGCQPAPILEIIGCKPDESGNLLAAHLAEFGQER
jgi:hypothetical protein